MDPMQIPAPLLGQVPPHIKYHGLDGPDCQPRCKPQKKKIKHLIDGHTGELRCLFHAEGKVDVHASSTLRRRHADMLRDLEDLLRAHGYEIHDNHILRQRDNELHDTDSKAQIWNAQSSVPSASNRTESSMTYPFAINSKRRRTETQLLEGNQLLPLSQVTDQLDTTIPTPMNSRRTSSNRTATNLMISARPRVNIRLFERHKWEEWLANAFKAIQQSACRFIAKEWIKTIHPKKQSTHPYNGNFPRRTDGSPLPLSPDRTKPPYWPPGVQHKEPDHIDKNARTRLLVHLLMSTPQQEITPQSLDGKVAGKLIKASDFLASLSKKKEELQDKWGIIENIIFVRTQLESWEEGGRNDDEILNIDDYEEDLRPSSGSKRSRSKKMAKAKAKLEQCEEDLVGSPTEPAYSDHEPEDDTAALKVSFASNVTQGSSRSTAAILRPKLEESPNNQLQLGALPATEHPPYLNTITHPNVMGYGHGGQAQQHEPVILQSWPTTTANDSRMNGVFANDMSCTHVPYSMADSGIYNQDLYYPRVSTINTGLSLMSYHDPRHFGIEYAQPMDRNAIMEMAHETNPQPGTFSLAEEYSRAYAQQL